MPLAALPVDAAPVPVAVVVVVVHHVAGIVPVAGILHNHAVAAEGNPVGYAVVVGVLRMVDTGLEGDILLGGHTLVVEVHRNPEGAPHIVGLARRTVGAGGRLVHHMVIEVRHTGPVHRIAEVEPPALGTGWVV